MQGLNLEVAKLRRILPPDAALNAIRDVVDATAASSGIHIDRFDPRQPIRHAYVAVPIDTEADGSIEGLASFFDALRNKTRIINVSEVTLEKGRAKFLLTAFALPD